MVLRLPDKHCNTGISEHHEGCRPIKKGADVNRRSLISDRMARPAGFEPAAYGLEVRCSIQLSYGRLQEK